MVLNTMEIMVEEIELKLAEMIGKIAFKLSTFKVQFDTKQQLVDFFKNLCQNKEVEMRRHAAYNLACFHMLYHDSEEKLNIDF